MRCNEMPGYSDTLRGSLAAPIMELWEQRQHSLAVSPPSIMIAATKFPRMGSPRCGSLHWQYRRRVSSLPRVCPLGLRPVRRYLLAVSPPSFMIAATNVPRKFTGSIHWQYRRRVSWSPRVSPQEVRTVWQFSLAVSPQSFMMAATKLARRTS